MCVRCGCGTSKCFGEEFHIERKAFWTNSQNANVNEVDTICVNKALMCDAYGRFV